MSDASLAASFNSLMTFFLDAIDSYSSAKSFSTSTPSLLFGRSRMCPIDATTLKSRPKYLLMVFAFAGDSTTTSAFAIVLSRLVARCSLLDARYPATRLLRATRGEPRVPSDELGAAFLFTLARTVNPHEPAAAHPHDRALQFQLE